MSYYDERNGKNLSNIIKSSMVYEWCFSGKYNYYYENYSGTIEVKQRRKPNDVNSWNC